jgi:hypothetical protein
MKKYIIIILFSLLYQDNSYSQLGAKTSQKLPSVLHIDSIYKFQLVLNNTQLLQHADSVLVGLNEKTLKGESMDTKILFALLGLILAVIAPVIVDLVQKYLLQKNERMLVIGEMKDMYRHFCRNKRAIEIIKSKKEMPAMLHFKKMKIPEDSLIFSQTTFRTMSAKRSKKIYELKLLLRNLNIEMDDLIGYCEHDPVQNLFDQYLEYLIGKITFLQEKLLKETAMLKNEHMQSRNWVSERIKADEEINKNSGDPTIIYLPRAQTKHLY